MAKVILDAGHGGRDPGAVYNGRQEKDDVLQLAFDVGAVLEKNGVDVEYTRVTDIYQSPYEKAEMANQSGADFFVSLHRNARDIPNTETGVETLVYSSDNSVKMDMAENINRNLEELGFINRGVIERPNLVVLRKTQMPALLVEAGFLDSDMDNALYDANRAAVADAIAYGILEGLKGGEALAEEVFYRVQTGIFRNRDNAERLLNRLQMQDFAGYLIYRDGLYYVQVGAYRNLNNAIAMEQQLRQAGYSTLITTQ